MAERDELARKRDALRDELSRPRASWRRSGAQKASISLMECPFCAETIKDEALPASTARAICAIVRPVIHEVQDNCRGDWTGLRGSLAG